MALTQSSTRRGAPAVDTGRRGHRTVYALIVVALIGMHLRLSVETSTGAQVVPMYPLLLSAALLSFRVGNELARRAGQLIVVLAVFLLIEPFVSFAPESASVVNLLSALQLLASILSALIIIAVCGTLPRDGLRKLFFGFWVALMVLALLESVGLRDLFTSIRDALYFTSQRGIYSEAARDVELYGKIRPTALASEPSYLADTYMCMIVAVFLLDPRRGQWSSWVRLGLMVAISFAIAPSLKIVFYLLALGIWILWPRTPKRLALAGVALSTGFFVMFVTFEFSLGSILARFGLGETGSFFGRIAVAPQIGLQAIISYPVLGYGIGNTDGLVPVIDEAWQSSGAYARFPWYQGLGPSDLMSNGFWWQWTFLGVVGGATFWLLVAKILRAVGVEYPLRSIVCAWAVWYSGFAFVDPASWFVLALFVLTAMAKPAVRSTDQPSATSVKNGRARTV
jgi:hypothetical protein